MLVSRTELPGCGKKIIARTIAPRRSRFNPNLTAVEGDEIETCEDDSRTHFGFGVRRIRSAWADKFPSKSCPRRMEDLSPHLHTNGNGRRQARWDATLRHDRGFRAKNGAQAREQGAACNRVGFHFRRRSDAGAVPRYRPEYRRVDRGVSRWGNAEYTG